MKKEPFGLYVFRVVIGLGMFAFMCMLYWSSVLIENRLRGMQAEMTQLHHDIYAFCQQPSQAIKEESRTRQDMTTKETAALQLRPHIDPSLPNLLEEDPFYAITLPQMLGPNFAPHGTFKQATIGKPANLHPFSNWADVLGWQALCNVTVARLKFGIYETLSPNMAIKIEERKREDHSPEFWVHLRDGVFWQPLSNHLFDTIKLAPHFLHKHQVTAHDYRFYFDALMNPYNQQPGAVAGRTYLADIEEIEVIDPLTFVVRWKTVDVMDSAGKRVPKTKYAAKQLTGSLQPLASFVYQYFPDGEKIIEDDSDPNIYRTHSVWAQNFSEHWAKNIIVSCGAWIFDGITDRQITFIRNRDHYFPLDALGVKREDRFKNTPESIWQSFKEGDLDTYSLRPDQLIESENFLSSDVYQEQAAAGKAISRLDYLARSYAYVGWNEATPFFANKRVRQAMTMAIDRDRIINTYLNGLGIQITGPFSPFSSSYDHAILPWPFDTQRAIELLEEEGWYDSDGDGVIDKMVDNKRVPFTFRLTYFVKNPTTKAICEYIATALKKIGINCQLHGVDIADLSAAMDAKSFDAVFMGWGLGTPPEDPRQLWYSTGAKEPGSSNFVGFENAEVDTIINRLTFENSHDKRVELYHRFQAIIHEEQPYTFLYAPKTALLYREYLQNVFIPAERQDLIPGADVPEPISSAFWIKNSH